MIARIFLILVLCASSLYGVSNEELFLQANSLVKQHEFAKAYAVYESIGAKGEAVWYNMGLCAYAQKKYYNALLMFARARRYATFTSYPVIMRHYYQAKNSMGLQYELSTLEKISMKCTQCSLIVPLIGWQLISSIVWVVLLACIIFCKRHRRIISLIAIPILIAALGMIFFAYRLINDVHILIQKPLVKAFVGPDEGFSTSLVLKQGDEVPLVEMSKGWYKVQKRNEVGWIQSEMGDRI